MSQSESIESKKLAKINQDRLDLLINSTWDTSIATVMVASLIVAVMYDDLIGPQMVVWAGAITCLQIFRETFNSKVRHRSDRGGEKFTLFYGIFVSIFFAAGIVWGVGVYLFLPDITQAEQLLVFFCAVFGMAASTPSSVGSSVEGVYAYVIPMLLCTIFKLSQYGNYLLAGVMAVNLGYIIFTTLSYSRSVVGAIRINVENHFLLDEVRTEKNKADSANKEKSRFMAAASHDLRQPLNSMGLFIYALRQKMTAEKQDVSIVNRIEDSHVALSGLFDALLEVSQLDSGTVSAEIKSIPINFILQPLIDELREQSEEKGLTLNYHYIDVCVDTDPLLLSRILRNLIGNAIKYTQKGCINVSVSTEEGVVSIKISDTGIGIPESEFETIFDEYQQLSNKRRDRRDGIGLGLAIVKKMCELLDHNISLTSEVGVGSVFEITAQCSNNSMHPQSIPSNILKENYTLQGVKVLVVDDEPEILSAMELILKGWMCDVQLADSYIQVQRAVNQSLPDIILCDYRLQDDMNGIDVVQAVNMKQPKPIPALIISGETDPYLLDEIEEQGFRLLNKPVKAEVLKMEMSTLLSAGESAY